ncbi:MAG: hypothetical protein ACLR5Y_04345 [Haemophilus parainfluenzae]
MFCATEDFYKGFFRKMPRTELVWLTLNGVTHLCHCYRYHMTLTQSDGILHAWAGFGAAFGPVVIFFS